MNIRPLCRRVRLLPFLAATLAAVMLMPRPAAGLDTFVPACSMTTARAAHTATLLQDGSVLVAGGGGRNGTMLTSAELYLPSGIWKTTGPMETGRQSHTATLLANGKVLVTGGYTYKEHGIENGGVYLACAELYNPATRSWSPAGEMQSRRHGHTATLLPGGKVLVVGGGGAGPILPELYDPATNSWATTGTELTNYNSHAAVLLHDGRVLVVGGSNNIYGAVPSVATARLYNPGMQTWTVAQPMGLARTGHTATLLPDGRVFVVGYDYPGRPEIYTPSQNNWSFTVPIQTARGAHATTLLPNGKVLVSGGVIYNDDHGPDGELFDPAATTALDAWTPVGADKTSLTCRRTHTATLLPGGRVLIAGGWTVPDGVLATAQLYQSDVDFLTATSIYAGLVKPMEGTVSSLASEGFFSAVLMPGGGFTGRLLLDGRSTPITGSFDVEGIAHFGPARDTSLTLQRLPRPACVLELALDLSEAPGRVTITGTVTQQTRSAVTAVSSIHAGRAAYDGRTPATTVPPAYLGKAGADGIFHVILPAIAANGSGGQSTPQTPGFASADYPQGTGVGAARISRAGIVTFAATLADGAVVTTSTRLTPGQTAGSIVFPLFAQLYNKLGFLSAGLVLDSSKPDSDFSVDDNYVCWSRPAMNTQHYCYGWPEVIVTGLAGAKFTVPLGESLIPGLPLPSTEGNALFTTYLAVENSSARYLFNLGKNDAASFLPGTPTFSLLINHANGLMTGNCYTDAGRCSFRGIIYQKGALSGGEGFYLTPTPRIRDYQGRSGQIRLRAAVLK